MKLKALALCATLGGSIVALALPAQSAISRLPDVFPNPIQYNDAGATHADASGNTDAYRSGSDNANVAANQPSGNPDAYRSGSDNANVATNQPSGNPDAYRSGSDNANVAMNQPSSNPDA